MRDFTGVSGASGGDAKESPLPATRVTAGVLNSWKDELANVITDPTGGDTALDPDDSTQLLTAIKGMIASSVTGDADRFIFPGGRVIEFGTAIGYFGTGTHIVYFPTPFATACRRVLVTGIDSTGTQQVWADVVSWNASYFTFLVGAKYGESGNRLSGVNYMAHGL